MIRLRLPTLQLLAFGLLTGCWYHRVDVPSPVTHATRNSNTEWSFLWKSKKLAPDTECVSGGLKEVVVRSNWAFSLVSVATLGLVSPARVERHCARVIIREPGDSLDTMPSAAEAGATYVSLAWGGYQGETPPNCNSRPLARVVVKPNPLFDLISVVTLGGISPARIRWSCVARSRP